MTRIVRATVTVAYLRGVFPDLNITIEDIVVSRDRVAVRSVQSGRSGAPHGEWGGWGGVSAFLRRLPA